MASPALELREAVLFLAAASGVVPIMQRLRISPVLGFLLVGVALGPFGLGHFTQNWPPLGYLAIENLEAVRPAAELGVMFLLFMIGLDLSLDRLWQMRRLVFGLGGAQVVLTAAALGLAAFYLGQTPAVSLVLGSCLALSSTAIVMQLLTEKRRLGAPVGRTCFAVLLFQDLAVVPILFLVGTMGESPGTPGLDLALALGKAALAIGAILLAGRLALRPLLRFVARTESRELFLGAVLLAVIGTAAITEAAGLSLALGAFMAGLLLAETEYRHRVAVDLEPFKGLLLGVFFVSVGMTLDPAAVARTPLVLLAAVAGLFALKGALLYLLTRLAGETRGVAAETALLLGQGGEFALVVVTLAASTGLLSPDIAQGTLLAVGLSMLATPPIAWVARRLGQKLDRTSGHRVEPDAAPGDLTGHAVIVGYGRVGQMIGDLLDRFRLPHLALDQRATERRGHGATVYHGDATQTEILARLGAGRAAALVVTTDDPEAASRIVRTAQQAWPTLPVFARVRDAAHARELLALGAAHVTPEALEASFQLGQAVLERLGVPTDAARELVAERRDAARRELQREAPS